ncbi:MAG: hypothetical protein ACRD8W_01510 [Nitrososphaeraceae archaeon]
MSPELLAAWNHVIKSTYDEVKLTYKGLGSHFSIQPSASSRVLDAVIEWNAHPRFLESCLGSKNAQVFCDLYSTKAEYQNEYCEYRIVERKDSIKGISRPKRVQVTTEFRDYWTTIAMNDPNKLREMVAGIVGVNHDELEWHQLYGGDPFEMTPEQRKQKFKEYITGGPMGNGWAGPSGTLNVTNALCMIHPINGLYDLLYSLMLGAVPYASRGRDSNDHTKISDVKQIFLTFNDPVTNKGKNFQVCSHTDSSLVREAYEQAYDGKTISIGNPLGAYILSFNSDLFFLGDIPIPPEWIKLSRGQPDTSSLPSTWQHMEFGPPDNDPTFLDDITIKRGGASQRLIGGYQILEQLEVGIMINVTEPSPLKPLDYRRLEVNQIEKVCSETEECRKVRADWAQIKGLLNKGVSINFGWKHDK